ncbi:hypothetical protein THOD04_10327 [Vibrio owensii]|nr:hypothetical protein THOD04_10327 [Vibrio owensii]
MLLSSKPLILPKLFAPFHQELMHSCYEPIFDYLFLMRFIQLNVDPNCKIIVGCTVREHYARFEWLHERIVSSSPNT